MYNFKEVVFIKLSDQHIPYFGYAVVEGQSKGGPQRVEAQDEAAKIRYLLDEFNTEQMLKEASHSNTLPDNISKVMRYLCRAINSDIHFINSPISSDEAFRRIAKDLGAIPLIRLDGLTKAREIGRSLEGKSLEDYI